MSGYLLKQLDDLKASTRQPGNQVSLKSKVTTWLRNRPSDASLTAHSMADLCVLFDSAPQYLGPVLHELGWTRRRSWKAGRAFSRYWVPPVSGAYAP